MSHSPTIYQVSDLANQMRRLMETSYPEIWIEGELSSLSTPASGHFYFSLKDETSQLRCAMFKNRAGINRYKPKAGDLVRVRAKISVYTARGDLQCIVQHVEEAGEGILQRRYEELKQTLNQLGLFNQDHKKQIPQFAKHIGIVTSPTGAAINDILSTLKRRNPSIPVTIYPSVVQGDTAAKSLINSIADAVQHGRCDVLILSRGGGSLEDLWCFNEESLAHAIFDCPIPIVSGVGHEVDITIADLVSDLRAPTPTAAAELLSPDRSQLVALLNSLSFRLPRSFDRLIQRLAQNTDMTSRQLTHPSQQLSINRDKLLQTSQRLQRGIMLKLHSQINERSKLQQRLLAQPPHKKIEQRRTSAYSLTKRLALAQSQNFKTHTQRFNALGEQLNLVSPLATLDRGFAIARDGKMSVLRTTNQVVQDDSISVQLSDGKLFCNVTEIES